MTTTLRQALLAGSLILGACTTYVMPRPADFSPATTLEVQGATGFNQRSMTIGDYAVRIDRGSTEERNAAVAPVSTARKRQNYSFVITRGDSTVFSGGCSLSAQATNVHVGGGVQVGADESAGLDCELLPGGRGRTSWRLTLAGNPDRPLNGQLVGTATYTLEGVGTALGSTRHGPTGGYYIKQDGRTVAAVQTVNDRQVNFAADAFGEHLLAAAAVLLLIDESVKQLD